MNILLIVFSFLSLIFGVYWYFIHIPNYHGYVSNEGAKLLKYLNAEELLILAQQKTDEVWILDVREAEYYLMGHIPEAKNFPHDKVAEWYHEIPKDKSLVLYCDLSLKTQNVIVYLEEKGYTCMLNWGKYKRWNLEEVVEETISV